MYKLTRPDGFDFYSGIINYRENIGKIIRITDFDSSEKGVCGKGLHASSNPNDCFIGAKIPCAAFKVMGISPIARDRQKTRYKAVKVIEEIYDLDKLFGWRYAEVINPINPLKIVPPKIIDKQIDLLRKWHSVRHSVRHSVGHSVWYSIWDSVGDTVGDSVRHSVRHSVGHSIGAYIGSLFLSIKKWKYIVHKKGRYPFQPAVDLWKMGLIPSFDGDIWRLHGGEKADILWKNKI